MKKFFTLALLAAFMLGMAGVASAATTLKTSGDMQFVYGWSDNTNFFSTDDDKTQEDDLYAAQRMRAYFDWSASESLRGVLGIEVGTSIWGVPNAGADLDADDRVIEVKHAYMDFTVPNTGVAIRMGVQPVTLPGNLGSPIFDYDVPGILAQYKFNDMFSGALGWFRLYNRDTGSANNISNVKGAKNDEVDAFALMLPIKGNGFEVTPWAMYAMHGANASAAGAGGPVVGGLAPVNATAPIADNLEVWWYGGSFKLSMFAPFEIMADVIYGTQEGSNNSANDRAGWFFDAAVNYKMDAVTPGVFFLYSTGDDDDPSNGSEKIPTVGGNIVATSFGMAGAAGLLDDGAPFFDDILSQDGTGGLWIIGAQLADFSFVNDLKHTFRVAYGTGTNDVDLMKKGKMANDASLTDKDHFWEVNFDSSYAIYENLTAYIEMGWVKLDLTEDWKSHSHAWGAQDVTKMDDAWKLGILLKYSF